MKDLEIKLEIYEKMIGYHEKAGHTSTVASFKAEVEKIKELIGSMPVMVEPVVEAEPALTVTPAKKTGKKTVK